MKWHLSILIEILKKADVYEKTLILFTSDHGMAFSGGKTTVYEPGLRVPFVVRNPYVMSRGMQTDSLVSHIDITRPHLLVLPRPRTSRSRGNSGRTRAQASSA